MWYQAAAISPLLTPLTQSQSPKDHTQAIQLLRIAGVHRLSNVALAERPDIGLHDILHSSNMVASAEESLMSQVDVLQITFNF